VQFECDNSLVEELRGLLEPTACCALAWHNVGFDDACFDGLFGLLSHVVEDGVVSGFFCFGVCLCGGVCFVPLCTNIFFFLFSGTR
jgi:hypothetical protein